VINDSYKLIFLLFIVYIKIKIVVDEKIKGKTQNIIERILLEKINK